jgi:hypothetical protein
VKKVLPEEVAQMAVDMFLKLAGITGESEDARHKGEIHVLAWSWDVLEAHEGQTGAGSGAGKPNFQDLAIKKLVDLASPLLLAATAKRESHLGRRTDHSQSRDAARFLGHQYEECPGNIGESGGSERRGSAV